VPSPFVTLYELRADPARGSASRSGTGPYHPPDPAWVRRPLWEGCWGTTAAPGTAAPAVPLIIECGWRGGPQPRPAYPGR
jgi:hypothetical protein